MFKKFFGNKGDFLLLLSAAILSLWSPYTLGYLLLCIYGARKLHPIKALDTYFANFILTFLILCASIMIAGVFTSYLNVPDLAIINFLITLFFITTLALLQPEQKNNKNQIKLYDVSDLASVSAALLIPILLGILTVPSIGFSGLVYRLAATGAWDGVQHFSFLQVDTVNNNYILDTSPITVDGERIDNNYPQGWHLASGNIANGIYPGVFDTKSSGMKASLAAYAIIVFTWYFLVLYLILKFIAYQLPSIQKSILRVLSLIIAAQFVAITILLPMWTIGFVNYIGLLAFIVLSVTHTFQAIRNKDSDDILAYIALAAIITAAVGLIWVLPVAFLVTSVAIVVATVKKKPTLNKVRVALVSITILMSLVSFALYLRLLLSSIDGERYLFVTPGWMPQFPSVTVGLVCCVTAALIAYKLKINMDKYVYILLAFLLPLTAIYFVSYFKLNDLGYYQVKLFGIVFLIISMFTLTAIVRATEGIKESSIAIFNSILSVGAIISVLGAIFVFSGQNMNVKMLHKNPQYASAAEEKMIINFAYTASNSKVQAVVLNKDMKATQINGSGLFNRRSIDVTAKFISVDNLSKRPDTCLVYIFFDMSGGMSPESENKLAIFNRLDGCLKMRSDEKYETEIFVPETMRPEMSFVNVYNAKVVYY